MKRNIIIAAATAAAAAGIAYYATCNKKSKKSRKNLQEFKPAHHMTDVFARAKDQAVK